MRRPNVYQRSAPRARHDVEQKASVNYAPAARAVLAAVIRVELAVHMPMLMRKDSIAIQGVLEAAGVELIREDGGSAGVHLRRADKGEAV